MFFSQLQELEDCKQTTRNLEDIVNKYLGEDSKESNNKNYLCELEGIFINFSIFHVKTRGELQRNKKIPCKSCDRICQLALR